MAFAIKSMIDRSDPRQLWPAIKGADLARLQNSPAEQINASDRYGITPLLHAACLGRPDVVQTLIDCGADVNATRVDGFTPLLLASFFGHTDVVRLLIKSGADVKAATRSGTTAEMWAAARGFHDLVEYLRQQATKPVFRPVEIENAALLVERVTVASTTPTPVEVAGIADVTEVVGEESERVNVDQTPQTVPEPLVVRKLKEPPDIWELVHENQSAFKARSAFLSHIRGIRGTTAAIMLVPIIVVAVWAFSNFSNLRWRGQASDTNRTELATGVSDHENSITVDSNSIGEESRSTHDNDANEGQKENVNDAAIVTLSDDPKPESSIKRTTAISRRSSAPVRSPDERNVDDSASIVEPSSASPPVQASGNPIPTNSPPGQKRPNTGNSQLIERPSNSSPTKPKTIQWP